MKPDEIAMLCQNREWILNLLIEIKTNSKGVSN